MIYTEHKYSYEQDVMLVYYIESCCLGLAACRGLSLAATATTTMRDASPLNESGGAEEETVHFLNERLLKVFGQTTNHGGSALMESSAQNAMRMDENRRDEVRSSISMVDNNFEETEVGGTAGMGEAALGAYRFVCRLFVVYFHIILCGSVYSFIEIMNW